MEVVEQTLQGRTVQLYGLRKKNGKKIGGARLDLPKIRKNPLVEIIAVSTGYVNIETALRSSYLSSPQMQMSEPVHVLQDKACPW